MRDVALEYAGGVDRALCAECGQGTMHRVHLQIVQENRQQCDRGAA